MTELEPVQLILLKPEDTSRTKIGEMRRRLAKEFGTNTSEIGYCIDRERHGTLGHNAGFAAMREKGKIKADPVLVIKRREGGIELVPHTYIGSRMHPFDSSKYVHFYLEKKRL
ncbi:hypothetical protein HY571_02525 [Candidatus Micrarchaeota archaeon]|nr:hypothetical protein [Candidatus Micrarchaeota archaeon]